MVMGIPNVGKSSLINQIKSVCVRGSKVAKTGASPGVTRYPSKRNFTENSKLNKNKGELQGLR